MKKSFYSFQLLFWLFLSPVLHAQIQYSPATGDYKIGAGLTKSPEYTPTINSELRLTGGIPCNPNTFWAVDTFLTLIEYTLIGNAITPTGNTYPWGLRSIIIANVDTAFSPTFVSPNNFNDIYYYNGITWPILYSDTSCKMSNGGGFGGDIYMDGNPNSVNGFTTRIYHYSQGSLDTSYAVTPFVRRIGVADEAVDAYGNGYFFVASATPPFHVDTLIVVSRTGAILHRYSISFDPLNAYGCFILNDSLYIGFGSSSPTYAETLVPVALSGNTATLGTPIPFPGSGGYKDLESCNQGVPVSTYEIGTDGNSVEVYPVPSNSLIKIRGKTVVKNIIIQDIAGRQVKSIVSNNVSETVNVSDLRSGLYLLLIFTSEGIINKKIEVVHD